MTRRPMTTAEIALLREVVRWRRNRGIRVDPVDGSYREPVPYDPTQAPRIGRSVVVIYDPYGAGQWSLGVDANGDGSAPQPYWHKVNSVAQAADLLVYYGLLPARFCSAYRAGWHAAETWLRDTATTEQHAEFKRLFHDPDNISFPAGEES